MKKRKNMLRIICLIFIFLMLGGAEPANCKMLPSNEVTTIISDKTIGFVPPGTKLKFVKLKEVCE